MGFFGLPDIKIGGKGAGEERLDRIGGMSEEDIRAQRGFLGSKVNPAKTKLLQQLQTQAAGQGPSIAESQLKAAMERNLQQQLAAAKSQRGVNPAIAQRNLMRTGSQLQAQTAEQGAIARMQEQQAARQALANQINQEQQYQLGLYGQGTTAGAQLGALEQARQKEQNAMLGNAIGGLAAGAGPLVSGVKSGFDWLSSLRQNPTEGGAVKTGIGLASTFAASKGGRVPGPLKNKIDSKKNDIVPAALSPGEVVVPKSVVNEGPKAAAFFVEKASQDESYDADSFKQDKKKPEFKEYLMKKFEAQKKGG